MSKERIFELIRKEEAALFVGAGMSKYAGYPLGSELAELLYNNLTDDLRKEIEFTTNLPKLAEDIYYLKGANKNYLLETISKEFKKEPTSTEVHQLLAGIPQIKTIITTNYDTLFESTNSKLEIVRRSSDCSIANKKKNLLFKIHGDLSDTSNLILTHADYINYFVKDKESSIFWNMVKTKLVENHIVFIGYALEDNNIQIIIEKLIAELGDNRKEMFFVAPTISQAKLKYLNQKGIEYIQLTSEELIKEIVNDLKYNYIPGLQKGEGSADTAFDFAKANNIDLGLSKTQDVYIIDKIAGLNGNVQNEVNFKIEGEPEKTLKIIDSLKGKDFDDINLSGEILKEYNHFFNGIRINSQNDIKSIYVKKVPSFFGLFSFLFDDGFELDNYYMEIFVAKPSQNQIKFKINANDFELLLKLDIPSKKEPYKIHVEIIPDSVIKSVKNGVNFYNILSRITSNLKFKIQKDNKLFFNYKEKITFEKDVFDADFLLEYFNKLRKIEKFFDVQFTELNLQDLHEKNVNMIIAYIDKTVIQEEFDSFRFKAESKEDFDHMLNTNGINKVLVVSDRKKYVIKLHDIDFSIGYSHKYLEDAYVANVADLKNNLTTEIIIKSESNIINYQFTDSKTIIEKLKN